MTRDTAVQSIIVGDAGSSSAADGIGLECHRRLGMRTLVLLRDRRRGRNVQGSAWNGGNWQSCRLRIAERSRGTSEGRRRGLFQSSSWRRSGLVPAIVRRTHPNHVHQVMKQGLHVSHLVDDSQLANLAMMKSLVPLDVLLNVVKQIVHGAQRPGEPLAILLVLPRVCPLGCLEDLVGLPVGLCEARVVLVVVMQVETKLVGDVFESRRQIINVREAPERNRRRLRGNGRILSSHHGWCRVEVVSVVVGVIRPLELRLGRDDVAIAVVVRDDTMTMWIDQHMVMVPRSRAMIVVVVMLRKNRRASKEHCRKQTSAERVHDYILEMEQRGMLTCLRQQRVNHRSAAAARQTRSSVHGRRLETAALSSHSQLRHRHPSAAFPHFAYRTSRGAVGVRGVSQNGICAKVENETQPFVSPIRSFLRSK